jgi:hypothetical protein
MKKRLFFTLAAAALLGSAAPLSAQADPTYEAEDLLLFFRNPEGTFGTRTTVGVSLGSTWNIFRRAATPVDPTYGSTISLGNIGAFMTQTYGSDWTGLSGTLFAGAVGNSGAISGLSQEVSNADYARTVYVTKPRNGVGDVGQADSSGAAVPVNNSSGVASAISAANSSLPASPGVFTTPNTADNNPLFNGNPATAYTAIPGGVMGSLQTSETVFDFDQIPDAVIALDLYRVTPVANALGSWEALNTLPVSAGAGYYLGVITLTRSGDIYFTAQGATEAVPLAPFITSGTTASGQVGAAFSYQIEADNSPASYGATGLPAGLTVNSTTGLISGTPTTAGTTIVSISATNAGGTAEEELSLTVTPGVQSISFTQPSGQIFAPNKRVALSASASSGLAVSFASSNPNVVSVTGNIATIRAAGQAIIVASQAGDANYSRAVDVNRTLTVAKGPQTIRFIAPKPPRFRRGAKFILTATATSSLPVTFVSSNPRILTISGRTATIVGKGRVVITARQIGNANYTAARNVAQIVTIR